MAGDAPRDEEKVALRRGVLALKTTENDDGEDRDSGKEEEIRPRRDERGREAIKADRDKKNKKGETGK